MVEIGDSLISNGPLGTFGEVVTFEDVYEIDERLNSGGFGTVHKAHFKRDCLEVYTVKAFQRKGSKKNDDKIILEAELLRQLTEIPGIVELVDFYISNDKIYILQELAKGGDLLEKIMQHGTYDETAARSIARTLLVAVHALHTRFRLVHRDIKPENVLLRNGVSETDIVLCDFGSARYLPKSKHRGLVSRCGLTAPYSAPELLEQTEYRQEVDIRSIGCTLFVLLGGYMPFDGEKDEEVESKIVMGAYGNCQDDEIWDDITVDAKDIIQQMLTIDRHKRCTAHQALQHQWFCDSADHDSQQKVSTMQETEFSSEILDDDISVQVRLTQYAKGITSYTTNTANKLSATLRASCFDDNNHSYNPSNDYDDLYYIGDEKETETEKTALIDTFDFSSHDDVLFVMGNIQKRRLNNDLSSHSCSSNSMLDLKEVDAENYDDYSHNSYDADYKNEKNDADKIYGSNECVSGEYYTIEELQKMSVPGLDYKNREKYLCEIDFKKVFGATREEVATWKPWKVTRIKRMLHLW